MAKISTRERIIQQSAALFNTYGYHACSLSHIMEATQLKKGGIYNHFKNKDEIAIEAFNYNYQRVLDRFQQVLSSANSPTEKLFSLIDVFVSFIDDPIVQGGGCPIFNTAMDATNTHPELKEKAKKGIKGLKRYVEIKLNEGIAAGEFKSDINVEQTAAMMISTLEGAIIMSRVEDDNNCLDFAVSYIKNHFNQNILKEPVADLSIFKTI